MLNPFRTVTENYYEDVIFNTVSDTYFIVEADSKFAPVPQIKPHEVVLRQCQTKITKKWWEIWK